MAERKTQRSNASVKDFIAGLENARRRADCTTLVKMMRTVSGQPARMWGPSIIGFGEHHYRYASSKQTSICKIGFAPRVNALAFYLPSFSGKQALLDKLGKYKTSKACLYINKLEDVDLDVLQTLVDRSYHTSTEAPC